MAVKGNLADARSAGTELFNTSEKVFEDIKAKPGEKSERTADRSGEKSASQKSSNSSSGSSSEGSKKTAEKSA